MPQQNTSQARVINPILTTHAQGYVRPGNVGRFLFPPANVATYGGQVLEFGLESFRRYNTKRAPGSSTKRITFGYAGKPYAIVPEALEALVPNENLNDAAQVPGIDLASDAIDVVLDTMELAHEYECADLARGAGNYDSSHKASLSGTSVWAGSAGDPSTDIKDATEAVRTSTGVRPNTVILSASSFAAASLNAKILDRLKYTSAAAVTTDMLARLWNVANVYIGDAIGASGAADTLSDIWGNDVVIAYVAPATGGNSRSAARPSFGYTYTITGMPLVRNPYQDNNANSWVYPVAADRTPVLSGITAGYLLQNAGAAS